MNEVMLYVLSSFNGTDEFRPIDLFENESLPYTQRFQDVAEFKSNGSFTRSFRIPASERNENIFAGCFNANASSTFVYTMKAAARIDIDTIPYATGHIQLNRVFLKGEVIHEYEITFYAEAPDLVRAIGDAKLASLASLSLLNHEVNYANVTTGSAGQWDYALCDRGQRWSENGESGTRPVYNNNNPVAAADLTPLVSSRWLFDEIISDAGFTWAGWNSSTVLADSLDQIWVPWLNSRYIRYTVEPDSYFFACNNNADETGIVQSTNFATLTMSSILSNYTEAYDNGGNVAAEIFTAPFSGYYSFKMWVTLEVENFSNSLGETMTMVLSNPNGNPYATSQPKWHPFASPTNKKNYTHDFQNIYLNAGDEVEMAITITKCTFTLHGTTFGTQSEQDGTGFKLYATSQPLAGEDIDMVKNAPDIKRIDFMRDIIKMHNLAVIPDRFDSKKIYFEPMGTYLGTGATLDWTNKVDTDKDMVLSPTTDLKGKVLKFTYKAGADVASEIYVKQAGRVYGDYVQEGYSASSVQTADEFATGDKTIELVASSTPCLEINGTSIITAKFLNDGGEFINPGLRFVYIAGVATAIAITDDDLPGPSPAPSVVNASLNVVNHYSTFNPGVGDLDLNWAPEVPLFDIAVNPYNNLFNRFYRDYLNDIYDFRARKMEAYLNFTLGDLVNFKFADKIWIKDSYWRVLEISDYLIGSGLSTKVTFLKIVNADADCTLTPDRATGGGQVIFKDSDDVDSDGNPTCCERYGYRWDDTNGKCYASEQKPKPTNAYQSALTGWGLSNQGSQGPNDNVPGSGIIGSGMKISPDAQHSLFAGQNVEVKAGNFNVLSVGDTHKMGEDIRGGAMLGKNIEANWPGFHLGGGWETDDRGSGFGRSQVGKIIFSGEGDFTSDPDSIPVVIEGIAGKYLEMNDNATWMCSAHVAVHRYDASSTNTNAYHYAIFTFRISYTGGASAASAVNTVIQAGDFGTLGLTIDTATDTDQQRFSVTSTGGGGYPYEVVKVTMELNYVQVRTT